MDSRVAPRLTAARTAAPTWWCAVRNGMPCCTSRLARAVAPTKPFSARCHMRSGTGRAPLTITCASSVASSTARRPGQTAATASVPTSMALVNGVARMVPAAAVHAPIARPALARTCSSRNALRLCGIAELPPTNRSGKVMKPNSVVLHNCRSVPSRLIVSAAPVAAPSPRSAVSRLATASSACRGGPAKPSSAAVRAGLMGSSVPAAAPAPNGQRDSASTAWRSAVMSRPSATATPVR